MRIVSRHILRTLAAPFIWGVAALTGLMLLNQLAGLIDRFGGKGLRFDVMVEAVLLTLPALLTLTLPMAVLVSVLYGYSQLAGDLELVAMYANGLSVWRMARPALVAVGFIVVINFLVYDQLVPSANGRLASLRDAVARKLPTLAFRPQTLNPLPPLDPEYVLRAERIDSSWMWGITIFDLKANDTRRIIRADSGTMAQSPSGTDLLMSLYHGEALEFQQERAQMRATTFAKDQFRFRDVENTLERTTRRYADERAMSSCELQDSTQGRAFYLNESRAMLRYYTQRDLRYIVGLPPLQMPPTRPAPKVVPGCGPYRKVERWFRRVMLPAAAKAEVFEARGAGLEARGEHAPRGVASLAGRIPPRASSLEPRASTQTPQTPQGPPPDSRFLVPPQNVPSATGLPTSFTDVQSARYTVQMNLNIVRGYAVEYHKKFAIPLGSVCFVLIGMALALKYPRSGIGLVIGGSLVIFLGFYILLIGGENVAKKGFISAPVAMYGPLVLFTIIGLLAVNSANREMGTARTAGIIQAIAGLFRRRRD